MNWHTALLLGGGGGAVVSLVAFCVGILRWQEARKAARARRSRRLPRLNQFIDPYPDAVALVTRVGLGAVAGYLFHAQLNGIQAAIAVGAAAPALLSQFGALRSSVALYPDDGTSQAPATSKQMTRAITVTREED